MSVASYLRSVSAKMFRRQRIDADMDEELRSHIDLRADDLERSGLTRADAERRAHLEFGSRSRIREECQESIGGNLIDTLTQDVRFSARLMAKSPGFTAVAVLTLAIVIAANAVAFAALNAAILRPLNLPRPQSLYGIERASDFSMGQSYLDYLDLRDRNRSFESLAAFNINEVAIDAGQNATRVWVLGVSGNYFDVLSLQPSLGRFFHAADERGLNSAPYLVVAHNYWHSSLHADPAVIGKVVQLNRHPFTIIGVAPPDYNEPLMFLSPDFYVPLVNTEQFDGKSVLNVRGIKSIFMTFGHLKADVTTQQAASDLDAIGAELERTYPKDHSKMRFKLARPSLYGDAIGGPMRAFTAGLMLLAGLILLAACANLGSLFAARAADRSREVALRLALGASRSRVLRQLFTEAMLIALFGGAVGLLASNVMLRWLSAWRPFPQFPLRIPIEPDAAVYAIALLLAVGSGFFFGVVPVRQVLRTDPYEIVKAGARITGERRLTFRDLLIVVQIAICAVLVTSSFVAVRGLQRSLHSNFGFQPANALLVNTGLYMTGYRNPDALRIQRVMFDAVASVPGVDHVGLMDSPPLTNGTAPGFYIYGDEQTDLQPSAAITTAVVNRISPDYLAAAGTKLLRGRDLDWHDDNDAPRVALVNSHFAKKVFGSDLDCVGRYFKTREGRRTQIVGLVEDGKFASLTESPEAAVYLPLQQSSPVESWMVVRSRVDPQRVAENVRNRLRQIDSGLPLTMRTWNEALSLALFPARVATVALGILGGMGAVLSITGIFGLAAYSVSKRLRELGIRVALGAQRSDVLRAALGRAVRLLGFGSFAGLILGLLAGRVLTFVVYQATPRDPIVLAGVVVAMFLIGLFATLIPARRALRVDPAALLREQ